MITTFRLALWYARVDLFEPNAWRVTRVNIVTVAVALGFAMATYGLVYGYDRVEKAKILADPLNLSLRVTGDANGISASMVKGDLERLKNALEKADAGRLGVFPMRTTRLDAYRGDGSNIHSDTIGRTLVFDPSNPSGTDPLLKSRPLAQGWPGMSSENSDGFILTPRFLEEFRLGDLKTATPRTSPTIDVYRNKTRKRYPVLGVTRSDLPFGHLFIVSENFEEKLHKPDPEEDNKPYEIVRTGVVPDAWPGFDRNGKTFKGVPANSFKTLTEYLGALDYDVRLFEENNPRRWRARSYAAVKPPLDEWKMIVKEIARLIHQSDPKLPESFLFLDLEPANPNVNAPPAPIEEPVSYSAVVIYCSDVDDLKAAAKICNGLDGLGYSRDVLTRISFLDEQKAVILGLLFLVEVVLVVIACWNLYSVQALRSESQASEVGMLKAMGVSGSTLSLIYLAEGAAVWLIGASLGAIGGLLSGLALAGWFHQGNPFQPGLGYHCPAWLALTTVAISFLVCLTCAWLSTSRSRSMAPSQSLRANS